MAPISTSTERAGSGLALLAVLVPSILVAVIASDMVNLMLPSIGADFGASEAELAWVVTGFLLMFAIGIPFYGRITDRVSLRLLFGFALLTYAAGSLICALAPNLPVLVLGRIVTGTGAAALPVLSIIAVTKLMPPEKRGVGIGVLNAAAGIGMAAGPALGGGIGQFHGWSALFWLMLVVALMLFPAALRVLPSERPAGVGRLDLPGGILLGSGAGLILFGITQAQVAGFGASASWVSLAVGMMAIALFGWRTVNIAEPFVPPALFTNRVYRVSIIVTFLTMLINLGALVFVPILLIDVNGLRPGAATLVVIPAGVAAAILSPLIGRLADRIGTRSLVVAGLLIMGLSALFLSIFAGDTSVVPAGVGLVGLTIGFFCVMIPIISAAASALPEDQVGVGIGILQGAQFLGAGAGPALFGVLITARQQSGSGAFNPFHVGQEGAAFSDGFMGMALVAALALAIAFGMRPVSTPSRDADTSEQAR